LVLFEVFVQTSQKDSGKNQNSDFMPLILVAFGHQTEKYKKENAACKQNTYSSLIQTGNHAPDAILYIGFSIPQVKQNAIGIHEKKPTHNEPDKIGTPGNGGNHNGQNTGNIQPNCGQIDGFAIGNFLQSPEPGKRDFWCRVQKAYHTGKANPWPEIEQEKSEKTGPKQTSDKKKKVNKPVLLRPKDTISLVGGLHTEKPMQVVATHGGEENKG
jgi:hypothetical protein